VPLPESKPLLRAHAASLVPNRRAGDFAQALMDLGATICTPKRPNCLICPWTEECLGRRRGIADTLPRRKEKATRPIRQGVAFWIERDGKVLLRRRPEKGLLGGMMEIPSTPWAEIRRRSVACLAPLAARWDKRAGHIAHTFTHFHLELDIWRATAIAGGELRGDGDYRWVAAGDLAAEALPSVMRKIVAAVAKA
jgi:A/G-specific adenine glycosylase